MPQFLYAAHRDAVVVRECEAELLLSQPHQGERTMPFFQVVLRVAGMLVRPFFPPRSA